MNISQRIFKIMKEKRIAQKELAEVLKVPISTVSTWKIKETSPPAEYIQIIADYLECSVDYLLTGKEKATREDELEMIESSGLSDEKKEILKKIQDLPNDKKEQVMEYINFINQSKKKD